MPTVAHSERKSSERFPPFASRPGFEELDRLIADGKGDAPRAPAVLTPDQRREKRFQEMRERAKTHAHIPIAELSRPIQISLPGPPRKLARPVREALAQIDIGDVSLRNLLTAGKGSRELTRLRQYIAVYLRAKKFSLPAIGRMLGGLNHASVLYLIRHCPARERELLLADIERAEERQKQENKLRSEPIDYTSWDEWI